MSENKRTQWYIGAPNGVVVCVDHVRGSRLSGVLYHSYSQEGVPFENIEQMTLRMEKLYDWLRFPYPGVKSRTFGEEKIRAGQSTEERKRIMSDKSLLSKHGDMGTFIIRVQHRQNSSWQGRITWMEEDKTVSFRSVWEMIKLIESAVDTVAEDTAQEKVSWFDGAGE